MYIGKLAANMTDNIDVPKLMKEVAKYPFLYDAASDDFKDKDKKHAGWVEIAATLYPHESRNTIEFDHKVTGLKTKFYKLKSAFKKRISEPSLGTAGKSAYKYAREMNFLLEFLGQNDFDGSMIEAYKSGIANDVHKPTLVPNNKIEPVREEIELDSNSNITSEPCHNEIHDHSGDETNMFHFEEVTHEHHHLSNGRKRSPILETTTRALELHIMEEEHREKMALLEIQRRVEEARLFALRTKKEAFEAKRDYFREKRRRLNHEEIHS